MPGTALAADGALELIDGLRVMGASKRDIIFKVVVPGAVSWIYVGQKLAIPYALIGAVLGELIASNRGPGYVLESAARQFDTAGLFAALLG
jgi:NitT/TauT family transport system permease protein